jgi:hypothetical protein
MWLSPLLPFVVGAVSAASIPYKVEFDTWEVVAQILPLDWIFFVLKWLVYAHIVFGTLYAIYRITRRFLGPILTDLLIRWVDAPSYRPPPTRGRPYRDTDNHPLPPPAGSRPEQPNSDKTE